MAAYNIIASAFVLTGSGLLIYLLIVVRQLKRHSHKPYDFTHLVERLDALERKRQ